MAKTNNNLTKAKKAAFDEFYTLYEDIEQEFVLYENNLKDKIIYANCDDVEQSNFIEYLCRQGPYIGIKKLYGSKYTKGATQSYYITFEPPENIEEYNSDNWKDYLIKTSMEGDGDFRSNASIELLKKSDVIVGNPPYSLFREFVDLIIENEKEFLFLGNLNAITYKNIFNYIKENKIWFGQTRQGTGTMWFRIPDDAPIKSGQKIEDGIRYQTIGSSLWFTNFDHNKRHEPMILIKDYYGHEEEYPKYDNYPNAININKTVDIPKDFMGIMGVPVTWLTSKYCVEQFEIINLSKYTDTEGMSEQFVKDYYDQGNKGVISVGHPYLCYYDNNHKAIVPYARILIRRRQEES